MIKGDKIEFFLLGQDNEPENTFNNIAWKGTSLEILDFFSTTPATLPFFEDSSSYANLTVQLGFKVNFSCKVNDLTDKTTVSKI